MIKEQIEQLAFKCAVEMEMPFNMVTIRKSEIILGYINQATTQLQKELGEIDRRLLQTIDERDECEQKFSHAYYLATGNSPEWSNNFGHDHAVRGIEEVVNLLKEHIKQLESQLSTARESALREAMRYMRGFAGYQSGGEYANGIEALIATPASEGGCEWKVSTTHVQTPHGPLLNFQPTQGQVYCHVCGKPIYKSTK